MGVLQTAQLISNVRDGLSLLGAAREAAPTVSTATASAATAQATANAAVEEVSLAGKAADAARKAGGNAASWGGRALKAWAKDNVASGLKVGKFFGAAGGLLQVGVGAYQVNEDIERKDYHSASRTIGEKAGAIIIGGIGAVAGGIAGMFVPFVPGTSLVGAGVLGYAGATAGGKIGHWIGDKVGGLFFNKKEVETKNPDAVIDKARIIDAHEKAKNNLNAALSARIETPASNEASLGQQKQALAAASASFLATRAALLASQNKQETEDQALATLRGAAKTYADAATKRVEARSVASYPQTTAKTQNDKEALANNVSQFSDNKYQVNAGDSLFTIAGRLKAAKGLATSEGMDEKSYKLAMALIIAKKNGIESFDNISSGQTLTMPTAEEIRNGMAHLRAGILSDGAITYSDEMRGRTTSELVAHLRTPPPPAVARNTAQERE